MSLISFIIVLPTIVLFVILDCYCYFQILALLDLMIVYLYLRKCLISLFQATVEPSFFYNQIILLHNFFCKASFNSVVYFDHVYFQYGLLPNSTHMLVWWMFCSKPNSCNFCCRLSMKQLNSDIVVEMNLTVEVFLFSQHFESHITFWGIRWTIISFILDS
jgi:hypothetical protein